MHKAATSSTYVVAINEEPIVPEYDYAEVAATIAEIDEKIAIIKHVLDVMRKQLPKARVEQHAYMSSNSVPEYEYINYDLKLIKKENEIQGRICKSRKNCRIHRKP